MNTALIERVKRLRHEIHSLICNRMTYPNTILNLEREASEEEKDKCRQYIDECIRLTDAKLHEFIMELEQMR